MLRLLRRELATAEGVAAALLKKKNPQLSISSPRLAHAPSGLEVPLWDATISFLVAMSRNIAP